MPSLSAVMPEFSEELTRLLQQAEEVDLASSIPTLQILSRCNCKICGSFFFEPEPVGSFGPGHRNIQLEGNGILIVDVVADRLGIDKIHFVEVLDREDVVRCSTGCSHQSCHWETRSILRSL